MGYDEILKQLEEYHYAVSTESRLVRTGLKPRPEFSSIQSRYAPLFSQETIAGMRDLITAAPDARQRERRERTLFALIEGFTANATLPIEEDILTECGKLAATVAGERIGFYEFAGRIANEPDFEKRERLRTSQIDLVSRLTSKRIELEHANRQALSEFGFASAREYAGLRKKVDYEALLRKLVPVLEETTGLYRRVMTDVIRKAYGRELGETGAAHVLHWRSGAEFKHLFPADDLLQRCSEAFATTGLDLAKMSSIRIDAADRPKKNPRACCYAAKVPEEVHLIIRPKGGYDDYRAFMHEGGHAVHFANSEASLPYEWRHLARSHALTEIFSFTMEQLTEDPAWLEHVLHVPKAAAERVSEWALLGNLFMLRRYIAKYTYELAFDEKPYDAARNRDLYAKTLKDLTGFRYEPEMYLEDTDELFYSADYLRAWIASAQLQEHLTRTFGDRWFLKRSTGDFLKSLYAKGVSWDAEELVRSLGMTPWDPLPLIRRYDAVAKLLR